MSRSTFNPQHAGFARPRQQNKAQRRQNASLADKLAGVVKREELPERSERMQSEEFWREVWR